MNKIDKIKRWWLEDKPTGAELAMAGWLLCCVLFLVLILQQMSIREYKLACKDYSAAIEIYEGR